MTEEFYLLFCDDRLSRHHGFKEEVENVLTRQLQQMEKHFADAGSLADKYEIKYKYSQGLSGTFEAQDILSVEEWIKAGYRFDIVVTDLNFAEGGFGGVFEGLDIIEFLAKVENRPPWGTKFIILTGHGGVLANDEARNKYHELLRSRIFDPSDWKEEIASNPPYAIIAEAIYRQLNVIAEKRKIFRDAQGYDLYDVIIVHKDLGSNPIGVVIREKGPGGASIAFQLKASSYTFQALATYARKFLTDGQVARIANRLKRTVTDEEFVRLELNERKKVLNAVGINWHKNPDLCDIADDQLCEVGQGRVVTKDQIGFPCQEKLASICVKKLHAKEENTSQERVISVDSIRRHVREIRSRINDGRFSLNYHISDADFLGEYHDLPHDSAHFCGNCLIYRRKDEPGYSLSATVTWIQVEEEAQIALKLKELSGNNGVLIEET